MPPRSLLLLLPIIAILFPGCTTSREHVFRGRVENLVGEGWVEQGTRPTPLFRSERNPAGRTFMALRMDPEVAVVVAFQNPGSARPTRLRSPGVEGWLLDPVNLKSDPLSALVESPSARPLHGCIELYWRGSENFQLVLNVRSEETPPARIEGEIETDRDWQFQPHLAVLMMAYDMGIYNPQPQPRVSPNPLTRAPLSSIRDRLQPLLKPKEYRVFDVRTLPSEPSQTNSIPTLTVHNSTGWIDRPGVQLHVLREPDAVTNEELISICRDQGLRVRKVQLSMGTPLLFVDIYGNPDRIARGIEKVLRLGFGVTDDTLVEFTR